MFMLSLKRYENFMRNVSYRTDGEFIKVRFIYTDEEIHLPSPTSEKGKCQILFNSIFVKKSKNNINRTRTQNT